MALEISGYNDTFKAFVDFANVGGTAIARVTDAIHGGQGGFIQGCPPGVVTFSAFMRKQSRKYPNRQ